MDEMLRGLRNETFKLPIVWKTEPSTQEEMVEITMIRVGTWKTVGKHLSYGKISLAGRTSPMMLYWHPITDRRLARRISRKTSMRFSRRNNEYVFRGTPV